MLCHPGPVTTALTLLYAPVDSITIADIKGLLSQLGGQEAQTVEFKEAMAKTVARAVAAMANSYGGLVLVGVSDKGQIVGVDNKSADAMSNHCWEKLEPPWVPEIISVPLGDGTGKFVLVARIQPERLPRRPLLVDGAAYVRYNGTTRPASWYEMRDLFAEASPAAALAWNLHAPRPLSQLHDHDVRGDFVLRTGIAVPLPASAAWRPLSAKAVAALAAALDRSRLAKMLSKLAAGPSLRADVQTFRRQGLNRARMAQLVYWAAPVGWPGDLSIPLAADIQLKAPAYGIPGAHLEVTLDVEIRSGNNNSGDGFPWQTATFDAQSLAQLFDAVLASMTDAGVVGALADLADTDSSAIPQPREMHLVCSRQFKDVLSGLGLTPFPNAGTSTGGHVLADPALDLADPADRHAVVRSWLTELALDAGLAGMEEVVESVTFPLDGDRIG